MINVTGTNDTIQTVYTAAAAVMEVVENYKAELLLNFVDCSNNRSETLFEERKEKEKKKQNQKKKKTK